MKSLCALLTDSLVPSSFGWIGPEQAAAEANGNFGWSFSLSGKSLS
jgi:hypothetical protein